MYNPMDLSGKRILITGAGSGIGRETSIVLTKLGATVVLLDIKEQGLQDTISLLDNKEKHQSYVIDLSKSEEIEPLIRNIIKDGPFSGFVHCAGIAPMRPFLMTKVENIERVMRVNFYSFVEIVRILSKAKNGFENGGSIVAMSSTGSIHGKPTKIAYSASKASIDAAIRCMTVELKERKIRMNTVMPSWVRTQMFDSFMADYPDSSDVKEIQEKQYLGVTEPYEVANTIAFLLSDATKTITGSTILMDGGILNG